MKKIEFINLEMAVEHSEAFGGWIFHNENHSIWYDAVYYTPTAIMKDSPGSGTIKPGRSFKK